MPRFYLELISIIGLVSFILLLLYQGKDTTSLISTLGVFVAATFRMIPSLNRIIGASQSMKFNLPSVDIIFKEIRSNIDVKDFNKTTKKFEFQNEIVLDKVSFGYIPEKPILKNINLKIKRGKIIGIIGESGSGKSTLVDLLIGLHKPTSGNVIIDGKNDFKLGQAWRRNIGYVSQSIYLTDDSIKNNIALGVKEHELDLVRINQVIKDVQLDKFIKTLDLGVDTKVGDRGVQISGGQRQRIGVARALYNNPSVLVLDEATSALDVKTEKEVMKSIYSLKGEITIIIIAHRLTTLSSVDQIYNIINGKIIKV